ncbi:hypothetical protein RND81_14G102300 [Saponaria officinalis]|uniref:Pectate lyase n=1 Tax=Saponaria officinalis TaxID=3572 RepID=A0AAW1GKQ4_SAPOF
MYFNLLFLLSVLCSFVILDCLLPVQALRTYIPLVPAPKLTFESIASPAQGPKSRTRHVPSPVEGPEPTVSPVEGPEPYTSPEPSTSPILAPEPSTWHVPTPESNASPVRTPAQAPSPVAPNGCKTYLTGNPIDDCWRQHGQEWAKNRQDLANCGVGFGKNAIGGQQGEIYVVTNPKDDPNNPKEGTLRYGVLQDKPLWIVFANDTLIKLKQPLHIKSFKTIDGRGVEVVITSSEGTCLGISNVTNVIVHGIRIHDCKEDAMTITNSRHIWVDHCSLSRCGDGLIDVVHGSTYVTISSNYFTYHRKVMLLGNSDKDVEDKDMRITVAYNHFGEGVVQRLPRCRFGYFHVVNNHYTHWVTYAIGGSANPTIYSQGNRFLVTDTQSSKTVTKHMDATKKEWETWNWRSEGDMFLNGTDFEQSGSKSLTAYEKAASLRALPSSLVPLLTRDAGVLLCEVGKCC